MSAESELSLVENRWDAEWAAPMSLSMTRRASPCGSESSDSDGAARHPCWSCSSSAAAVGCSAALVATAFVLIVAAVAFDVEVAPMRLPQMRLPSILGAARAWPLRGSEGAPATAPERSATVLSDETPERRSAVLSADAELGAAPRWQQQHYALDCWGPCGGAGRCDSWCGAGGACCRHGAEADPPECAGDRLWPALTYHTCVEAAAEPAQAVAPTPPPEAPSYTFYLYRAQNDESRWTLGDVNIANLPGVLWYLSNEVMPRCPKRYGISRIRRYKITTKASPELYARGMNFGVRYSYDAGKCTGSNIRWLGPCSSTWDRFGYVVGCNNFRDHYPYPLVDTEYPDGVWYDLPLEGRCDSPTGAWNCTWSYEEAGEIRLEDLEAQEPGHGYCCGGQCTGFWQGHWTPSDNDRRVAQVKALFAQRFPELPSDMPEPICDFDRSRFWE